MKKKTIAIVGASKKSGKFSNTAVRTYLEAGWTVYPVNPTAGEIEGLVCYACVDDIPMNPERISVYLGPDRLLPLLEAIASRNPSELWLNPGTESPEVLQKAAELNLNVIQACTIINCPSQRG